MNTEETMPTPSSSPDSFQTFGDLLKYLRRREHLTQLELSIAVGYSDAQITRLEKNQRRPDLAALKALFIPALHIENEPELVVRFLELAQSARQEDAPAGLSAKTVHYYESIGFLAWRIATIASILMVLERAAE